MHNIQEVIRRRILILDGAMGTMIQRFKLEERDYRGNRFSDLPLMQKGNNDLLTLTRPDIVAEIHRKYLEAGADIIETNTFNAQRISMADYGCEAYCREINLEAARLARQLADRYTEQQPDKPRFVAGSVGPTNKTCSMSADVNDPAARALTFDTLAAAYLEQIEALLEGGIDVLLIETIFDTLNAKAAIAAAEDAMSRIGHRVPLMLSVTIADKAGRTLSGQTIEAFLASIEHADVFSIGLNCSFGAADMKPLLAILARRASCYVSAYPNAGLPNSLGTYDQTPEQMAAQVKTFVDEGLVNIIGGCCGTTDEYIAHYDRIIRDASGLFIQPRIPAAPTDFLCLSGLDCLEVKPENNFLNVGERCNVAGSRKFLRLIKEKNYDEAIAIARRQVEDGAQVIDINMDDGLIDTVSEMAHFLRLLCSEPEVARVPFMIDSSKWEVIIEALKCLQGKCIVNSISLKEGEDLFLAHARELRRYGAAVVVMAFDERGQADTFDRRIEICQRAYNLLTRQAGFNPRDIIFDPNILAICTGMPEHDAYAADFIRATKWIRTHLPYAHVSGGVSNLSFSFRGNNYLREAMHAVFLYHAIQAGMDMGIVNPASTVTYADIEPGLRTLIEDVVLNRRAASEELIEAAQRLITEQTLIPSEAATHRETWREGDVEERLRHALIHGIADHLDEDLHEALPLYTHAVDIIEGPLMEAMNIVGERFGRGQMFLPQVVKTARTMKRAVNILQPFIEAEKREGTTAGRALLATVKGDVHDIGKNIVGVVLSCNGYEVQDLGVMCPAEQIVSAVREYRPDFIGLSGLITPSLDEMVNTARALAEAGIETPILLGGATTSATHTALRIAPAYPGPVVWVKDASQMIPVAARLTHPDSREKFIVDLHQEQQHLRTEYTKRQAQTPPTLSLKEARDNKLNLF